MYTNDRIDPLALESGASVRTNAAGSLQARARLSTLLVAFVIAGAALPAAAGLKVYHTTDEDTADEMPQDGPNDPWDEVDDDGTVTITLARGERIWFAARNDPDEDRDKYVAIRISGPFVNVLQPCTTFGDEEAEGFMTPFADDDDAARTVPNGGLRTPTTYAKDYRMTPQPLWERFCFKCMHPAGINAAFNVKLFTSCSSALDLPPLSGYFGMSDTSFGAPAAMIGEPRYTELWLFPNERPVDLDEPATIAAPDETGPWFVEPMFVDPEGNERPLGGYRFLSDGAGLSVHDRFGVVFSMIEASDIQYDLFAFDANREQFDQLSYNAPTWDDDLDAYEPGPLAGLGGWAPWDDDPAAAEFLVTDEFSASEPNALAIDGADDAVRELHGYGCLGGGIANGFRGEPNADCGDEIWLWTAKQYVPGSLEGQQFFILLNTYESGGDKNWSLQLVADGAAGTFGDFDSGDVLPLIVDEWAEIRVMIDLDEDVQTVHYNGQHLVTKSWTEGVAFGGPGVRNIAALDLFANGSAQAVYYDDIEISRIAAAGACLLDDGTCDVVDKLVCEALEGEYFGHGTVCEPDCPADLNSDAVVNIHDLLMLLDAWGGSGPEGDVNGDGIVNIIDLLELLDAWGPC